MSFDYFYGPDDAEQYSFYRIPKKLITGDEFQEISTEAKLLYGLMLDRLQLSIRNQWFDALNRVYIIYTVEDIMTDLHCGKFGSLLSLIAYDDRRVHHGDGSTAGRPPLAKQAEIMCGNGDFRHIHHGNYGDRAADFRGALVH